eukprot:5825598-Lingulodinium_polyedra.AAC.1
MPTKSTQLGNQPATARVTERRGTPKRPARRDAMGILRHRNRRNRPGGQLKLVEPNGLRDRA